jgi:hypothetical protein
MEQSRKSGNIITSPHVFLKRNCFPCKGRRIYNKISTEVNLGVKVNKDGSGAITVSFPYLPLLVASSQFPGTGDILLRNSVASQYKCTGGEKDTHGQARGTLTDYKIRLTGAAGKPTLHSKKHSPTSKCRGTLRLIRGL